MSDDKNNNKKFGRNMEAAFGLFLDQYRVSRGHAFTHTTLDPMGKYYIGDEDERKFVIHYCNYISSKQTRAIGLTVTENPGKYNPLRIDVDLKASLDYGSKRQYTYNIVTSIIKFYQEEIKMAVEELDSKYLWCVLLEKKAPRVENQIVKDGFHIHFPYFICEPWFQDEYLRNRVTNRVIESKIWEGCNYTGPVEKFIDTDMGKKPWLMYGSAKNRKAEPFLATKFYNHNTEEISIEKMFKEVLVSKKSSFRYNLPRLLSIRGNTDFTPLKKEVAVRKNINNRKKISPCKKRSKEDVLEDLQLIKYAGFLDMLSDDRADDYDNWMRVGWTLFNIGQGCDEFLQLWIDFSKRSDKFIEGECEKLWYTMRMENITIASLKWMARSDNPDLFLEWKLTDVNTHIENSLWDPVPNELDVSKVVFAMYKDNFKCADATKNIWYEYIDHRWRLVDDCMPIRKKLSEDVINKYYQKKKELVERELDKTKREEAEEKEEICKKIIHKLKTVPFQEKVIKMCKQVFHDPLFMKKLDENRTLFGCENGVLDLKNNIFRDGCPDDYISISCGINYPRTLSEIGDDIYELYEFFKRIFPNKNIGNYFLDNVAIALEGGNINKTFTISTGDGDNGKSVTFSLIEKTFGEYCIKFPRSLFIKGRDSSSGGPKPELSRVRGKRIGIVQEISKTETMDIGPLKELTGNDSFFARGMYEKGGDIKPMFTLFSQMNEPPRIPGHDEATWNRIRIVDFESKFIKPKDLDSFPVPSSLEEQFKMKRFKADITFEDKIPDIAPAFLWMLVERRKNIRSKGLVEPTEVKIATSSYRTKNCIYTQFIDEMVQKPNVPAGEKKPIIKLSELHPEFQNWYAINHSSYAKEKITKPTILHEFTKRFGTPIAIGRDKGWVGYSIIQEEPEEKQSEMRRLLDKKK